METLLLLTAGAINVICFVVGAKVGQKVSKDEAIDLPSKSPAELITERRERKEAEKEQSKIDTIFENVERYDGTSIGQKDVH